MIIYYRGWLNDKGMVLRESILAMNSNYCFFFYKCFFLNYHLILDLFLLSYLFLITRITDLTG
jgi:hypothetical protein